VVLAIDNAIFGAGLGADGDGFAEEVYVAVSGAFVGAICNEDSVAGNSGVDSRLDGGVLARHVQLIC